MDAPFPFSFLANGGVFVLFAVGVAAVGAVAYRNHLKQRQRRERLLLLAQQRGWSFSHRDPFNLLGHRFALFRKGDGRGIENVVHGTADGDPVRVFDYWYYDESTDSEGKTSRSYSRFTCALVPLHGIWAPHLRIAPEHVFSRLGDSLGFKDQQFESEEFNRAFEVRCDDARFASTVIDARMMAWLLQLGRRFRIEVIGGDILLATDRIDDPTECLALHDLATLFRERIPPVTSSLYPGGGSAGSPR